MYNIYKKYILKKLLSLIYYKEINFSDFQNFAEGIYMNHKYINLKLCQI